jgi:hypothetical protein
MKIQQAGSHIDHMLRQTRIHHVQLSMMADMKANGLITIAAVMVTFSAPFLEREQFRAAVLVLMGFCLVTILLGTYTVMPGTRLRIRKGAAARAPGSNLLFFGTFAAMEYEQFEAEMEELMNDPSRTYEVQVREIYTLGRYLACKKYRALRCAYLVFTSGLLAAGGTLVWCLKG